MQVFPFTIEINAENQAEAQAKLDLIIEAGAFIWDDMETNNNKLTKSVLTYWALAAIGKGLLKAADKKP